MPSINAFGKSITDLHGQLHNRWEDVEQTRLDLLSHEEVNVSRIQKVSKDDRTKDVGREGSVLGMALRGEWKQRAIAKT